MVIKPTISNLKEMVIIMNNKMMNNGLVNKEHLVFACFGEEIESECCV
jgi:hypothetical protein